MSWISTVCSFVVAVRWYNYHNDRPCAHKECLPCLFFHGFLLRLWLLLLFFSSVETWLTRSLCRFLFLFLHSVFFVHLFVQASVLLFVLDLTPTTSNINTCMCAHPFNCTDEKWRWEKSTHTHTEAKWDWYVCTKFSRTKTERWSKSWCCIRCDGCFRRFNFRNNSMCYLVIYVRLVKKLNWIVGIRSTFVRQWSAFKHLRFSFSFFFSVWYVFTNVLLFFSRLGLLFRFASVRVSCGHNHSLRYVCTQITWRKCNDRANMQKS